MIFSINSYAKLSDNRKYRYILYRAWGKRIPYALFILLNPSTADETTNDPTVRRCISFAKICGYGAMSIVNLFAYRTTDPKELQRCLYPFGNENMFWIQEAISHADIIIAAWGTKGNYKNQDKAVMCMVEQTGMQIKCLGITKSGHPKHPLYLSRNTELINYKPRSRG